MDFLGNGPFSLLQMLGQKVRDHVEFFRLGEFRRDEASAGDNLQRALETGTLKSQVQSLALNQQHDVVPVAVNG
jgi:hypothetical protein